MAQSSREIYWSVIIADFSRSGMTHLQFCQTRHLPIHSFRKWLYRLRPTAPSSDRFPSDAPVRPIPCSRSGRSGLPCTCSRPNSAS